MSMKKMQTNSKRIIIPDEFYLDKYLFPLMPWDRIFFYGDLWAGKSTFIRHLLRKHFHNPGLVVRSPTYTYYQKYASQNPIYHFDLYRIEDIETFFSIGGMEIMENVNNIVLIEWPKMLEEIVKPTKRIFLRILEDDAREMITQN